jgi:hypothetical protein
MSYQVVDRELLSMAIKIFLPLAKCSRASIYVKLFSIWSPILKYILAATTFKFSCIISINTVSSFDICALSMASILLFEITMAALCFPFPAVNILYFFTIPSCLFWYS